VEQIRQIYDLRKQKEGELISSHGEAGRFFVSFLDNHDQHGRFNHPETDRDQVTLGIALLFTLQGIPSLYYGTEQGLDGTKDDQGRPDFHALESVREALWGKPKAFDRQNFFYQHIKQIAALRSDWPPLGFGRLYFRQVSGNALDFGHSAGVGGVVAFSRILGDQEVVIVANTNTQRRFDGHVLIDADVNRARPSFSVLYSNKGTQGTGQPRTGTFHFWNEGRPAGSGEGAALAVRLEPMEVQVLGVED
jgi:glycosidase